MKQLRNVQNLEKAVNLGYARFLKTRLTEKEQGIIEEALGKMRCPA